MSKTIPSSIVEIIENSKTEFDLTNDHHYQMVRDLADCFIASKISENDLWGMLPYNFPLHTGLAAMLAISKLRIQQHKETKMRIAVLINLIHEHHRLRPCQFNNPYGENSLRNKIKQLDWITENTNISCELIYVTGGCPWESEKFLMQIVEEEQLHNRVHLFDIRQYKIGSEYIKNQKGGEIIFGARIITETSGYPGLGPFDSVLFTDADMTFDLGQIGYLIDLQLQGKAILVGNRLHEKSILVKNPVRAGNGILMFRHFQRRLEPHLAEELNLLDTQCPWKWFSIHAFQKIVPLLDSMDWSIDTDFLSAAMHLGLEFTIIPATAIDSDHESHGHAVGHHVRLLTILMGILHQAQKYDFPYDLEIAEIVTKYIEAPEDLEMILNREIPEELKEKQNHEFGQKETITPAKLEKWIRSLRHTD